MGLDELAQEIESDSKERIEKLNQETDLKCKQIISQARQAAEKILEEAKSRATEEVKALEKRELAAARLETKKIVSEAREDLIEDILGQVKQSLEKFASSQEYQKLLPKYVEKVASTIRGQVVVTVRKKDRHLIKGYDLAEDDLDCIGGAILVSKDSTVVVDATIDSMFEDCKPRLRALIFRRMFA